MPSRALAPAGGLEGGSKNVRSEVRAAGRVAEPVGARGRSEIFALLQASKLSGGSQILDLRDLE
eukprot:2286379-Prymnesium_polylepis.1